MLAVRSFQLNGGHALIRLYRPNWARCGGASLLCIWNVRWCCRWQGNCSTGAALSVRRNSCAVPPFSCMHLWLAGTFCCNLNLHKRSGRAACRQRAPCKILGIFVSCFVYCFVVSVILSSLCSSRPPPLHMNIICGIVWLCAHRKIPAGTG